MQEAPAKQGSRGMLIAFRVIAAVGGLAVLVLSLPFTVISFIDEKESIHRIHNVVGLLTFGVFVGLAVLVSAWRPERQIAAFQAALAATLAGLVGGILSGDVAIYLPLVVPVVILAILHPARRRVFKESPPIWSLIALAILSVVPAVIYALAQTKLQREGVEANPHVEFDHYSGMAAAAFAITLVSFVGACRTSGRRFVGWAVGIAAAGWGAVSLALRDYEGALESPWNWLALAWGVAFLVVGELEERRRQPAG